MHFNQGSTLNPSNGSGDSGTSRTTASQARGADTRYAKKNVPTVRYHPDIAEQRAEAHQHSHSPVKSSQVRGTPVVSPPRTNQVQIKSNKISRAMASQARGAGEKTTDTCYAKKNIPTVRYHPDIAEKRPEAHQHSHSPVKSSQVRVTPVVSPPRTNQVQIKSNKISRAMASQARGAGEKTTDTCYAKKNIPTVRYHPDIAEKRPEAHQHSHSPVKSCQVRGKPVVSPPRPKALPLGLGQKVEDGVVEAVELQTRGQRENPSWFSWRQNRITASVAHRLAHSRFVTGQSTTPPASYLAAITGHGTNVKTRAMTWGIMQEAEAVRRYQILKSKALGWAVRVQECGLFIDPQRPWLAGSPDGIVEDQRTGQRLLCLEVKCPYKHRQNTVAQACREDPAFCVTIQDQGEEGGQVRYHLKPDHSYYTQIQCQLAVTGLTQADLVVFTLKETAIVPVTFDPAFWDDTLAKLEMFYTDAVLPYVRDNGLDVPAMRPEE
ncbi:uncharacterized protein LOC123483513 isoform X1 [Coregonus clupeaformis]|uniref:uncharacterized protein LOC123483513 isoform X1 n=1 Tax=Coregonus clupeaformis TaxID=59861 RepID=UPI001E1C4CDA|nr:uncharacterized protein LOC123483513 isoform X1 [Coregonus clupeaformis]XP_045069636.1 uncharacterized protein LOC123483513 isoform X1 [Coregonus clupeaformis]